MHALWWSIFRMGEVVPIYYSIIAFFCTAGAIALAIFHIYRHLLNYTEPTYQRYIVRIIFMVPVSFPCLHLYLFQNWSFFLFVFLWFRLEAFLLKFSCMSSIYATLFMFLVCVWSFNFLIPQQFPYVCVHLLFIFLFVTLFAFVIYIYYWYILFIREGSLGCWKITGVNFWPKRKLRVSFRDGRG